MSLKFELGAAGVVRKATEQFLKVSGLSASVSEGSTKFAVTNTQGTFVGVRSIIRVASENGSSASLVGASGAEKVMIDQWVATALQVSNSAIPLIEVESMVPSKGFLAGGSEATAGDLFLYCVAAETAFGNAKQYPNLASWSKGAEKAELIAPVKVTVAATAGGSEISGSPDGSPTATTAGKGGKAPKEKAARPSEEQLAALRVEKEAAKAAKAKEKETNAGKEGGGEEKKEAAEGKKEKKKEWGEKADKGKKTMVVSSDDLDLRIGKVVAIEKHESSDKLYVEKIDLGDKEGGPRTIVSGLVAHYQAEEILGAHVLVLCNMKPRSLAGVPSSGMVLCASDAETGKLALVTSPDAAPGTRVVVGTSTVPDAYPAIPSAKQMDELIKHFGSDAEGQVQWQGKPLLVSGQTAITAKIPNAIVK